MNSVLSYKVKWFQSLAFKFYAVLAIFILFISMVSLVSWRSLVGMAGVQKTLVQENIPEMVLSADIVRQSEKLIQSAPKLLAGSSKDFERAKKDIQQDLLRLNQLIADFEKSDLSKHSAAIAGGVAQMTLNLKAIEQSVFQKRKWTLQVLEIAEQMTLANRKIHKALVIEIDNQTFNMALRSGAAGSKNSLVKTAHQSLELKDILFYHRLLNLRAQTNIASSLLREAEGLSNKDLIEPIKERFLAAISACLEALNVFPDKGYEELKREVQRLWTAGFGNAQGVLGIFDLKAKILKSMELQNEYLKQNKKQADDLSRTIKEIQFDIQTGGQAAAKLFEKSLSKNQNLFFIINGISLAGALILAFFFIGPLIGRLTYLSLKMRQMSDGRLEGAVEAQGADEVKEMASALEVFRRNTLEAQRLGLVEKLALEVQEKNKKLEETIQDLNKTRNQLVIQEKLASLGQLTSGIAHEIKNPLNFINNFSKLSKNLIEELKEELGFSPSKEVETGELNNKEKQQIIEEIMGDIQSNMEKIRTHGDRANDIITGMLEHSRSKSGALELVDINKYMETYSNLAFHSKRSLDSSFVVQFEKDYDLELKPVQAAPQDISRVLLNILSNACDAIAEKSKKNQNYKGLIYLKTKKTPPWAKIVIRDNGPGIPLPVKEKIFNPFFTTKATGQGTGLGLSLVHDIVVKNSAKITAESKEGEFTEFCVLWPLEKKQNSKVQPV